MLLTNIQTIIPPKNASLDNTFKFRYCRGIMPSRSDITYFGAGPALLPTVVLEEAAKALLNYHDTGLGIAEHSHRSQLASDIINQTKTDLASCLDIPDSYEILFMQGGGTGQFG